MPLAISAFRTEERKEIRELINEFRFEIECEKVS